MPVVRTDGRSVARSRDYQIFWGGLIYLPMVLRWRASRAELRYYTITKSPTLVTCSISNSFIKILFFNF